MLINYIKNTLKRLVYEERSAEKLALSFSVGIFIAISPFIGFHNIMVFVFASFFRLNLIATFIAAHINNPLTTIPIYSTTYFFGRWLLGNICGVTVSNPEWVNYLNSYLTLYLGMPKLCFWSFMLGSTLMAIFFAILSYPIMRFIFAKIISEAPATEIKS